jgi:hypothetical protein
MYTNIIMEKKYSDAVRIGLICGVVIAVVYFVFGLIGMWLYSTPAMTNYMNGLMQPFKNYYNNSTGAAPYISWQGAGQPPAEYYIGLLVSVIMLVVLAIGLLAVGALAIKYCKELKNDIKNTFYIGAVSGIAAFVPVFIAMVAIILMTIFAAPYMGTLMSILPGLSAAFPVIAICETVCCCLPIGVLISAILSAIGAWGYAYIAHRITDQSPATA